MQGRTYVRSLTLLAGLLLLCAWQAGGRRAAAGNDAFSREQRRLLPLFRHGSRAQISPTAARYLRWLYPPSRRPAASKSRRRYPSRSRRALGLLPQPQILIGNPGGTDITRVNDPTLDSGDARTQSNPTAIADAGDVLAAWSDPSGVAWAQSHDDGVSFEPQNTLLDSGGGIITGHPVLGEDSNGDVFMAHMWTVDNGGVMEPRIGVATSDDFGDSFSDPVNVTPNLDPLVDGIQDDPWLAVDATGSANDGNIYVSWTDLLIAGGTEIRANVSTDGGMTFGTPISVGFNGEGSQLGVDNAGSAYLVWQDNGQVFSGTSLLISRSDDGGKTWGVGGVDQNRVTPVTRAGTDQVCNGQVVRALFGDIALNHHPHIAVDNSGLANDGRLYVVWNDGRRGDADIFLVRSDDQGLTWSQPVRVNQDPSGNGADQFFPAISVDNDGDVHVMFYDRRDDPANLAIHVYEASSDDGGGTWTETRLTQTSFLPPYLSPAIDPNQAECALGPENQIYSNSGTEYSIWTDGRNSYDSTLWGKASDPNIFLSRGGMLTVDEAPRLRVWVEHSFPKDVKLTVGQGGSAPWSEVVSNRQATAREDLFFDVDVSAHAGTLPPVNSLTRVFLKAEDVDPGVTGRIRRFELYINGQIFTSDDTPRDIPDGVELRPRGRRPLAAQPGETTVFIGPDNTPPTADAGPDKKVTETTRVRLNARGSSDPDGQKLKFSWQQISGPPVALHRKNKARPWFIAPQVTGATLLEFEVTVSDGVASDTDQVGITVKRGAPGTVSGHVQDKKGKPLVGAQVTITRADGQQSGPYSTDSNGNYSGMALPGRSTGVARFPNLEPSAPDKPFNKRLTVPLGGVLAGVNFTLVTRAASLRGTITDTHGAAVANAAVTVLDTLGAPLGSGVTGADGKYQIRDLDSEAALRATLLRIVPSGNIPRWDAGPLNLKPSKNNIRSFQYGGLIVSVDAAKDVRTAAENALVEVRIGPRLVVSARLGVGVFMAEVPFDNLPAEVVRVTVSNPGVRAEVRDIKIRSGRVRSIRIVLRELLPL